MVLSYLGYALREFPTHETFTGKEAVPDFFTRLVFWSIFFISFYRGSDICLRLFFPQWYEQLSDRKKREFPSYVTCSLHHLVVIPHAILALYRDYFRTEDELSAVHYAQLEAPIFPFIMGYLTADMICFAIPELRKTGKVEFLVHHLVSLLLMGGSFYANGHVMSIAPHLMISELANVFFNVAWITRTLGDDYKDISLVKSCEMIFAVLYFLLRVINFPIAVYKLIFSPYASSLRGFQFALLPLVFLQFFWFSKIVSSIFSRGIGGSKKMTDKTIERGSTNKNEINEKNRAKEKAN
jgi:hypothetical protein